MTGAETRAWKIVLDSIESRLLSGELGPGDHLPPERALATELGVGRSSVREALRVLEVFGLVRTQSGSGPQSGAIIIATPSSAIGALMRLQVAARGFQVADIVRTRLLLETAVASDLAERNDTVDLTFAATRLAFCHTGDGASYSDDLRSIGRAHGRGRRTGWSLPCIGKAT